MADGTKDKTILIYSNPKTRELLAHAAGTAWIRISKTRRTSNISFGNWANDFPREIARTRVEISTGIPGSWWCSGVRSGFASAVATSTWRSAYGTVTARTCREKGRKGKYFGAPCEQFERPIPVHGLSLSDGMEKEREKKGGEKTEKGEGGEYGLHARRKEYAGEQLYCYFERRKYDVRENLPHKFRAPQPRRCSERTR